MWLSPCLTRTSQFGVCIRQIHKHLVSCILSMATTGLRENSPTSLYVLQMRWCDRGRERVRAEVSKNTALEFIEWHEATSTSPSTRPPHWDCKQQREKWKKTNNDSKWTEVEWNLIHNQWLNTHENNITLHPSQIRNKTTALSSCHLHVNH